MLTKFFKEVWGIVLKIIAVLAVLWLIRFFIRFVMSYFG